jgi:hypothetical protein
MEKTLDFRGNLIRAGGDAKTIKGNGEYLTAILYMTPYKTLGANLCPMAETAGCLSGCLNTAGRGAMNSVQRGRARKAEWFVRDRASFMAQLDTDLSRFVAYCRKRGVQPAVRLNGTTDIRWELIADEGLRTIFQRWPNIRFYDYTKIANRRLNIPNYHLTFSYSEASPVYLRKAQEAMAIGMNVAVVFRDKERMPAFFYGRRVVDGDKNDLRFLDPRSVIVALYAKGKAKKDTSGFVIDYAGSSVKVTA